MIQDFGGDLNFDPAIVSVQMTALALIVQQSVSVTEMDLFCNFVNGPLLSNRSSG
jgi:hypothetical protein